MMVWGSDLICPMCVFFVYLVQGRRANKKAVKEEYNRLSDPGYAAKMRSKDREEVLMFRILHRSLPNYNKRLY